MRRPLAGLEILLILRALGQLGTGARPGRLHALKRGISMTSKSLWMSIAVAPQAVPLQGHERCDVVVVGSGIADISTAYELSERGRSVIVIDRGPIAGGMTARTSAHLAPLCDDLMSEMQKIKGDDQSKLFY
jgi:heterodisulfide reductase subunit A-like polyferredoxin